MRVLQVIDRMMRIGGAEKFVLDLSIALNKLPNVEVEVVSISTPLNDDFLKILENQGIRHHALSNKLYSLGNSLKLKRVINRGNFDIVHVHLFPALYYGSFAKFLNNAGRCKLVYTEHSTNNRRRNKPLFKICDRIVYRKYDALVAISDKVKFNLESHLQFSQGVEIINNGVDFMAIGDAPQSDIRKKLNISDDSSVITMVSRVTEGKDFGTIIRALDFLSDRFHAIFVGDGPQMNILKDMASESKASNRIHILGQRNDVYSLLKASDIIVLSTHHEGFSIAMLEAMACRKPFVASAVEGIKDLVAETAELFEYKNCKQLALILNNLTENNSYYTEVANRCYEFAKNYDINEVAKRYVSQYEILLQPTTTVMS